MVCPECGGATHVINSRPTGPQYFKQIENGKRRRRVCEWGHRFTTVEMTVEEWRNGMRPRLSLSGLDRALNQAREAFNKVRYELDNL